MKRMSFSPYRLIVIISVALILLTACERPIPRDLTPVVTEVAPTEATLAPPEGTPGIPVATEPYPGPVETVVATEPVPEATATPVPEATATLPTGEIVHVVQPGETLFRISRQYGVSVDAIAAANNIANVNRLDVGQRLVIPTGDTGAGAPTAGERTHVVKPGENLFRIGLMYGFTVAELAQYNGIANPNDINVGQVIRIPPGS